MAKKSINVPDKLLSKMEESMERKEALIGRKQSFTDWVLEAAAEKLARENQQASVQDDENRAIQYSPICERPHSSRYGGKASRSPS